MELSTIVVIAACALAVLHFGGRAVGWIDRRTGGLATLAVAVLAIALFVLAVVGNNRQDELYPIPAIEVDPGHFDD